MKSTVRLILNKKRLLSNGEVETQYKTIEIADDKLEKLLASDPNVTHGGGFCVMGAELIDPAASSNKHYPLQDPPF